MILVTGGTGLLGAHLLLRLLQQGHQVRAIVREGTSPEKVMEVWKHYLTDGKTLLQKVDWFTADIANKAELSDAFQGVEYVYHCAALISFDPKDKPLLKAVNITGTRNVVDLSLECGIKKLLHVSSIATVGRNPEHTESTEEDKWPVKARSPYTSTKTDAEMEVWRGVHEGLKAVIVNPSVILGPGMWQQSSSRFFDTIYHGLRYYTKGATGFVDAEDVVTAMIALMEGEFDGERFILNGSNLTYRDFFQKVAMALGVKAPSAKAGQTLTSLAWRVDWLRSRITGKPPMITRHSASSSHAKRAYSSEKYCNATGNSFRPVDDSISRIAELYLKEVGD